MVCHGVCDHTGVIADIRLLHLGDVQVPGLLRDEAAAVLGGRILIEDPGIAQL